MKKFLIISLTLLALVGACAFIPKPTPTPEPIAVIEYANEVNEILNFFTEKAESHNADV